MAGPRSSAMLIWAGQMVLNWLWSPAWFTLHLLWPAFAVIAAMLVLIVLFIANRWNRDRTAALLFVPYAAWVTFAGLLNLSISHPELVGCHSTRAGLRGGVCDRQ